MRPFDLVMHLIGLIIFVGVALVFDFTNGFHDAANAVATSIMTRALRPLTALGMAATLNVAGALVSTGVAATVAKSIIRTPGGDHGVVILFSALIGAIAWNLVTWRLGLPTASTHTLIGGLIGAGVAAAAAVHWHDVVNKVVVPMLISPVIGLLVGYLLMVGILWTFRRARLGTASRRFRRAQVVSSAAVAFGHGTQDAQKTMGVITLALVGTGHLADFDIPLWVVLSAAAAMGLGTFAGGWRIIRTVGNRITQLDSPRGFAAETATSAVLLVSAAFALPVSTTHVMASSVMGVGATGPPGEVRWRVARRIVLAWLLTIPGAAAGAWLAYRIVHPLV